ncbi:MAG TPA: hypothetical protein VGN90_06995 [Pyrinomonadaceae bacterium]|nr:hypothetical protein [Pyrinomonadaceae bacterium]
MLANNVAPRSKARGGKVFSMDEFDRYRADMNEKLLGSNHLGIKWFFALDMQAYGKPWGFSASFWSAGTCHRFGLRVDAEVRHCF